MSRWFNPLFFLRCFAQALLLCSCLPSFAADARLPLRIDPASATVELWSAVSVRGDPQRTLSLAQVLASPDGFAPPKSLYASLGLRKDVVWLRVPFSLREPSAQVGSSPWIFDINYPALNRADFYLLADGKLIQTALLGDFQPRAKRPFNARSHALALQLKDQVQYEIVLRVETAGAMILPMSLNSPSAFHSRAVDEQMLQGLFTSIALFLLLYSLMQWIALRETLYLKYAFLVSGSLCYSLLFFGVGDQYFWANLPWLQKHIAGLSAVVSVAGAALFIEHALAADMSRRLRLASRCAASVLILTAAAYSFNLISLHALSAVVSTVGLTPSLLGVPGALARLRRGDVVGAYFLAGWSTYFVSTNIMVALVHGWIDVNFWTMHSFQLGATFDMLIFMRIATLRAQAAHLAAQHAARERDSLISLVHSDPLTGLNNRRGLSNQLFTALPHSCQDKILAVYMLDLDGFKSINDDFGHDVGDALLVAVAKRLRATVRGADVVARLGGDEFVIMAAGLKTHSQAKALGMELLAAFQQPFELAKHSCSVGVTIGYALSPFDSRDGATLLKQADAVMYLGKQAGKNRLRWAGY